MKVPGGGGGCGLHRVGNEYTWEEANGDWIHRLNGRLYFIFARAFRRSAQ